MANLDYRYERVWFVLFMLSLLVFVISCFTLDTNHYYNIFERIIQCITGQVYFSGYTRTVMYSFWSAMVSLFFLFGYKRTIYRAYKWIFSGKRIND